MQLGETGLVARFAIHDGRREEFEQLVRDATAHVKAEEPDMLVYQWHLTHDGAHAAVYEVWASPDALIAHLQGPVGTEMLPGMLDAGEVTMADLFGDLTDELLAALDGLPLTAWGPHVVAAHV